MDRRTGTTRANFDGWELTLGKPSGAVEAAWSTTPATGEGLLVDGLSDAESDTRPPSASLLVLSGTLTKKGLAALVERHLELALVQCTLSNGFEAIGTSPLIKLWIHGPNKLPLRALMPLNQATRLQALYLDGTAPPTLVRWLATLKALRCLDLSRPNGEREVGRGLAALASLEELEQLGLRRANVSATVVEHVAALPALRRLDLSYGAVSAPPRAWRKLARLEQLRLCGVRGIEAILDSIATLPALRLIDLRGHIIEPFRVARLQQALPEARVLVDPLPEPAPPPRVIPPVVPTRTKRPSVDAMPVPPLPPETLLRFPEDAPSLTELHVVFDDERGAPCGFDTIQLGPIVARFHPEEVVRTLSNAAIVGAANARAGARANSGADPNGKQQDGASRAATQPPTIDQTLVALTLLTPAIQHFDPNADRFVDAAIDAARALLGDTRAFEWQWASMRHQMYRFVVGGVAAGALLNLLQWRAQRRGLTLAEDAALLHDVLLAELAREGGQAHWVFSHLQRRTRDPGFAAAISSWLGWHAAVMNDPRGLPRARVAALERLASDHTRVPLSVRPETDAFWQRTLRDLARQAVSPTTEMHLRRAARQLVAKRAPELFDALLAAEEIRGRPLPDFAPLVDALGYPDPSRVLPLAPDIDGATCVAALREDDVDAWFSALAFAPHCGDATETRTMAELAARLVGRIERCAIESGPCKESARLGELAARTLSALIRERAVARDGLIQPVMEALRQAPLDHVLTSPPGALLAVEVTAPPPQKKGATPDAILQRFLDRSLPAAERFALMQVCFPLRRDYAQRVVADPDEDGDLRALVGCMSGLVQPPEAPPLPLSEPFHVVSIANLRAALELGRHPLSVRRSTQALVSRLLPSGADEEALSRGAEALCSVPCPPTLRALVDQPAAFGRIAAARWLAVLGRGEDEGRIARVMIEEGGWTATRPQGVIARTPIEHLMAALIPETVVDYCDSDFDALLRIGYGDSGTARIRAKAYVLIARRHADAGRMAFARRSMEYAASLDAMNLDVARLRRSLSAGS